MPDEDYELMPHRTIANIKRELELLKKKAASSKPTSPEIREGMERLNNNITQLLSLFKEAATKMQVEEEPALKQQIEPLSRRIHEIEEENKKIAQGILVIADMIKELQAGEKKIEEKIFHPPRPVFRQAPMPPPRPMPPKPMGMPPPRPMPSPGPMPPKPMGMPQPRPIPPRPIPTGRPIPPGPMPQPSPLPPLPDIRAGPPRKQGFLSKILKKK